MSTFAAATVCRLLGQELLRLEDSPTDANDEAPGAAQAAGFAVASRGEAAIRLALDRLAAAASGYNDTAAKAFGDLYAQLARGYVPGTGFDPFRRVLRDCILETWPIAPGTAVLGEVLTERRLPSVRTVTEELDTLRDLAVVLEDLGVLEKDDPRPANRRVFGARRHAPLLEEIAKLVGPRVLRPAMGASRDEFEALIADGVIVPFTKAPNVKARWRLADGVALVAELRAAAAPVDAGARGWERILLARQRTGLGADTIIAAIRDRRIAAGLDREREGFGGILVRRDEVKRLAAAQASADVLIPAGTFGLSVGIKDKGRFLALIAAGHTPAKRLRHPRTGVERFYMSSADIAAFHRRFATIRVLVRERGDHWNTLRTRLKAAGVRYFSPGGADFGPLYLRSDVEAALE